MKKSPFKLWLCAAASEFVEGLADGFIIVAGGAQTAQAVTAQVRALTPQELASSILVAGIWYVAAFVKKNPPPFADISPAMNGENLGQTPGGEHAATVEALPVKSS